MSNIKPLLNGGPAECECRVYTVGGTRMLIIFDDEKRPSEPHIIVKRPYLMVPPPSRGMMQWLAQLRNKYDLGGV